MRTIASTQWRSQPWKNGRGMTQEVLRHPAAEVADFDVRISVAEVTQSGPFSTFPGYTRWSLLLEGGPIWLGERRLTSLHQLDGAVQIEARVDAPARLLNIIGRGIVVGVGAGDADIAFELATHETRVFDARTRVFDATGGDPPVGVWIAFTR